MENQKLRLGFLGFGEVGYRFAKDLSQAGLTCIVAYSRSGAKAAENDPLRQRAAAAGVELLRTPRALCARTNLIIAVTSGKSALAALRSVRPHLRADHIYVDANAGAVSAMETADRLLAGKSGFVDAAIMGPVLFNGIKVLTAASGKRAEAFRALLAPYGMNIQVVGEKPGAASAMKLIRSVCIKGLSAMLIESLEAARRYGILDAVAADIAGSMDDRPFLQTMKRYVCGTAAHAERRVQEMADALELLRSLGASTRMTSATRAMLRDVVKLGLPEHFGRREPDSITLVMDALVQARK
jgi:3-hydroxyisobutyrate dehydrogenase-like beta-hydroxyacid dehydrogenase